MDYSIFKSKLKCFSTEELKEILGRKLVDLLIEWTPENQPLFTKDKLAEMIITIHGINILKDPNFRKKFARKFSEKELLGFKKFLRIEYRNAENINLIINHIAQVRWNENETILYLLKLLTIHDNIFKSRNDNTKGIEVIDNNDKFYELLDYQFVIKQRILNHLNSKIELNRMLVHMPTGTGKTKTAMHTLCHYFNFVLKKEGLIIWMAHSTELLYQAYDTFINVWKHIGDGKVETHKLWGNFNLKDNAKINGFLFCGFQKLISMSRNNLESFNRLVNNCSLIIVDEAHKASANETKTVINKLMIKKIGMKDRALIGLTATPGRSNINDVDNNRLITMFDNKTVTIETNLMNSINMTKFHAMNSNYEKDIIKYFQSRRILAKLKKEKLSYNMELSINEVNNLKIRTTANGYEDFSREFLIVIGRNKNRNMAILNRLVDLHRDEYPTIIFACSVEHGRLLSTALSLKGIENGCIFGDVDPTSRKDIISRFKDKNDSLNVLINYEVLTTGFDSTNIKCVFITRPTQSVVLYSQMIGRGLRGPMMGGNEECLLIDIEDNLNRYNESMAYRYFDNYWSN